MADDVGRVGAKSELENTANVVVAEKGIGFIIREVN